MCERRVLYTGITQSIKDLMKFQLNRIKSPSDIVVVDYLVYLILVGLLSGVFDQILEVKTKILKSDSS